jgi:hypothetical protein
MNDRLRDHLITIARAQKIAYYEDVARLLNVNLANPVQLNNLIRQLDDINRYESSQQRPMLSAVVVSRRGENSADGAQGDLPGKGFFTLARDLQMHDGSDDEAFWFRELDAVYRQWR